MILGIIGGMGPMASAYFYKLLTALTHAACDSEHVRLLLSSRCDTPDRSAFLQGTSEADPTPVLQEEAQRLVTAGAELLAIPCHTAHCFYDRVAASVSVPVLHMPRETVRSLAQQGVGSIGLLATAGLYAGGLYQRLCDGAGLRCLVPPPEQQAGLHQMIYRQIKGGGRGEPELPAQMAASLQRRGADVVVLGCTELSVLYDGQLPDERWVDPLEILAAVAISLCGKKTGPQGSRMHVAI
ncbi:MAG: amino acid racemase [Eubacteriales bacterium]